MKYRKKPVVIEAMRFDGTCKGAVDIEVWADFDVTPARYSRELDTCALLVVHTLEGTMEAKPGDWIIKGIMGEFYPCKPDIFEATYEPAE